ncbi:hypothetical protein GTQ43_40065 [Nostoc sp. KVJ3]|nr:hypothetical protein [Nostoc sp. KVJ3]
MTRYALVVGITDYKSPLSTLSKPATDAEAVAKVLKEHGDFENIELLKGKATKQQLGEALKILLRQQAVNNEALIYFTGHGITVSDLELETQQAYLATSDLQIVTQGNQIVEQTSGISLINFNQLIKESHLSSLVVLLDCCYSGHFLERHLIEKTLTAFSLQRDYYFIAACRDFQQAYAKKSEKYSIFTTALLTGLSVENANDNGQVTGDRLFDRIATELRGSGQEPIRMGWGRSITLVKYLPKPTTVVVDETCPYQGLLPFYKEQARFFFGRDKVIQQLIKKLSQANFVPIIGASGSGKSSVVRAGLIPALEKNGWRVLEIILPGVEPLAELKRAFTQLFERTELREISTLIDTQGLCSVISRLSDSERLLLVVDQFEEIFTLGCKEEDRQRFIELLTQCSEGPLAIVTTMRADFLEYCLSYESLTKLIQEQAVYVPPLLGAELEQAIASPARLQGYQLETGLLGAIQQEVLGQEKGCLPLLQFALTELWEQRDQEIQQLTVDKFNELDGVMGALNRHAEKLYASFNKQQQDWMKRIFLKLVRTGLQEKDTRQRQLKNRFLNIASENPNNKQTISDVLEKLIQGRLLVSDREPTGEIWVDLAHEALMEGWQRFAQWRTEDRENRRIIDRIENALQEWQKQPIDENLMMGGLLTQVRRKWQKLESDIDISAREFYKISVLFEEKQRQKYEVAQKSKNVFLANVSHELRTPLNAVIGLSKLLQEDAVELNLSRDFISDLETINSAGRHQLEIINEIIDLSKIEAGRMTLYPETFEIATLINNIVHTVKPAIDKNSNTLEVHSDEKLGAMYADQTRIKQVLLNLLSNAAKFTTKGKVTLTVTTQTKASLPDIASAIITFIVNDTGIGISPTEQKLLFQPFSQGANSVNKHYGGTGLGLAISRHFCQMMGGEILVSSQLGIGSTFTVNLPLIQSEDV